MPYLNNVLLPKKQSQKQQILINCTVHTDTLFVIYIRGGLIIS